MKKIAITIMMIAAAATAAAAEIVMIDFNGKSAAIYAEEEPAAEVSKATAPVAAPQAAAPASAPVPAAAPAAVPSRPVPAFATAPQAAAAAVVAVECEKACINGKENLSLLFRAKEKKEVKSLGGTAAV